MKKILSMALMLLLSITILAACGNKEKEGKEAADHGQTGTNQETPSDQEVPANVPQDLDEVVVSVGDSKINKREANIYLYSTKINVENMGLGSTIWVNEIQEGKTFEQMQLEQLKNTLTYIAVMKEEAKQHNISLSQEEKDALKANTPMILASFPQAINDYYGFNEDQFNNFFESQELVQKTFEFLMKDYEVNQADLKERYEADQTYQKLMEIGKDHYFDRVRARHILISTLDENNQPLAEDKKAEAKKKAEDILAKAKAGEDFAQLAKTYTEDPGSKDNGGEYIFGYGQMVPEFEKTAFELNPGQISDLVETTYGYHIIKLEEKIASTTEDIQRAAELEGQLIADYESQLKSEAFQTEFEEKIKSKYEVKFNDPVFDTLSLSYTVPVSEEENAEPTPYSQADKEEENNQEENKPENKQ